mmetsp:Transcript_9014/g.23633  ORF Transcript_9014/g.23633 Transcript_9014/m.23633 type:complete len:329 (-) Transcript_9014:186-1172(-)
MLPDPSHSPLTSSALASSSSLIASSSSRRNSFVSSRFAASVCSSPSSFFSSYAPASPNSSASSSSRRAFSRRAARTFLSKAAASSSNGARSLFTCCRALRKSSVFRTSAASSSRARSTSLGFGSKRRFNATPIGLKPTSDSLFANASSVSRTSMSFSRSSIHASSSATEDARSSFLLLFQRLLLNEDLDERLLPVTEPSCGLLLCIKRDVIFSDTSEPLDSLRSCNTWPEGTRAHFAASTCTFAIDFPFDVNERSATLMSFSRNECWLSVVGLSLCSENNVSSNDSVWRNEMVELVASTGVVAYTCSRFCTTTSIGTAWYARRLILST